MRRHVLVLLALLSITSVATAESPDESIRATLDAQVAAWNRADLEGFMDGYLHSEDLVFTSGGKIRRGWETTFRKYRERYGGAPETMGHLSFGEIEIHPLGNDAAWVLGQWKLTWPDESIDGGIFTLVMQRTDSGWKVVHDHTSSSSN